MKIDILTIGRLKENYLTAAVAEYTKRITPYAKITVVEVPDEKAPENLSQPQAQKILAKEAAKLDKYLDPTSYKIALAIQGKQLSSEALAATIARLQVEGCSKFTFIIGGSLGLDKSLLDKCQLKLSFSPMTFPHQLMRVILLEQIYRCFKINAGEPYHK